MKANTKVSEFVLEEVEVSGYERVVRIRNEEVGLDMLIAIHNSILGPALGGIRIYPYKNFDLALKDALRLAKGMTYKSAMTELGLGGGKSVVIADPLIDKSEKFLLAVGKAVDMLNGNYICAEDVGCTVKDVQVISKATKYVVGLPQKKSSGDPSKFTAFGTFRGIQAVLKKIYGSESLEGKKVVIQGLGSVGHILAEMLFWAGADLTVTDVDEEKVANIAFKYKAKICLPEEVFKVECDVFAPCALGGIINDSTLKGFRCRAIAGCANNQLLEEKNADQLAKKGILYAPDYVINAGGLLNVASEITEEGYNSKDVRKRVNNIHNSLLTIFEIADKNKISTSQAANMLVEYKLKYAIGKRVVPVIFHHAEKK